jgi:hypothetical protein
MFQPLTVFGGLLLVGLLRVYLGVIIPILECVKDINIHILPLSTVIGLWHNDEVSQNHVIFAMHDGYI